MVSLKIASVTVSLDYVHKWVLGSKVPRCFTISLQVQNPPVEVTNVTIEPGYVANRTMRTQNWCNNDVSSEIMRTDPMLKFRITMEI